MPIDVLTLLVLTDKQENSVHRYKCKEKSKITRKLVIRDECIEDPRSVCVWPDRRLFVACENRNSIVHVSASGIILGSFQLNMTYLIMCSVSKAGRKLVVSNSAQGDTKLQFFNVHTI